MLISDSGLTPQSDWHFRHSTVGLIGGGGGVGGCSCRVHTLHLHPLPVGGYVNNVATGKINCGQAAGLRGSLWEQREHRVGKACDLWGWEEISQGRLGLPFNSVPKEMKALCKEDIEISSQKIVDILERPLPLIFIVEMGINKEDVRKKNEGKNVFVNWFKDLLKWTFTVSIRSRQFLGLKTMDLFTLLTLKYGN